MINIQTAISVVVVVVTVSAVVTDVVVAHVLWKDKHDSEIEKKGWRIEIMNFFPSENCWNLYKAFYLTPFEEPIFFFWEIKMDWTQPLGIPGKLFGYHRRTSWGYQNHWDLSTTHQVQVRLVKHRTRSTPLLRPEKKSIYYVWIRLRRSGDVRIYHKYVDDNLQRWGS